MVEAKTNKTRDLPLCCTDNHVRKVELLGFILNTVLLQYKTL